MSETHDKELRYFIISYTTSTDKGKLGSIGMWALSTNNGKYINYKDLEAIDKEGIIILNIIELNEDDYNDFTEGNEDE